MLRTNIIGAVVVVLFVLTLVGIGISLRIDLNWNFYFKILGSVAAIALLVSLITHLIPSRN